MDDVSAARGVRGRVVLLVLAAVQFTNILDFMIVMPLGPKLMKALAIDAEQFAMIVASYTFSASAAGLLAASLVDRFDRKLAFLTLYSGFLLGTLCCGLAPSYYWLLGARVVTGAFGGVLGGLAMAIVGDVFPEEKRGAANGALMSAFAVATVVGLPFGLELDKQFGWQSPFLMLAALGLIVLIVGARVLPRLGSHLEAARGANPLIEVKEILIHPEHLWAFSLIVMLMVGGFSVIPFIATYLVTNVGVSQGNLSWVYIAGGVLSLAAGPVIGKLADRHGKFRVYRVVAPISAVFMLVITNLPRVPLVVAIALTAGLMAGNAGRMVVALTMVTSCVEPRRRGSFMSVNASLQHLASGLGAYIGGRIIGQAAPGAPLTHYDVVGYFAVATTLASVAIAARIRPYAGGSTRVAEEETAVAVETLI